MANEINMDSGIDMAADSAESSVEKTGDVLVKVEDAEAYEIDLGSGVDISSVETFLESLEEHKDSGHIRLLASQVEKLDTTAFQVLASLKKYTDSHNGKFEWVEPSAKCLQAATLLGFHEMFELGEPSLAT